MINNNNKNNDELRLHVIKMKWSPHHFFTGMREAKARTFNSQYQRNEYVFLILLHVINHRRDCDKTDIFSRRSQTSIIRPVTGWRV